MQNLTGIFTKIKGLQWLVVSLLMMASCDKTPEQIIAETPQMPDSNLVGMFIANEGNFQWGNASLSFYNPASGLVQTDIYKANNGKGIGDVLQSICSFQDKLYLVVNNSQKISVLNAKTWKEIHTITGFNSPRYFLPVNTQKAYVSDLYENAVYVLNLNTQQMGLLIGGGLHSVGNVAGAGYGISKEVGEAAISIKLARVALLSPALILFNYLVNKNEMGGWKSYLKLPWYLWGFLLITLLSSFIKLPEAFLSALDAMGKLILIVAMAAIGLKVSFKQMFQSGKQGLGFGLLIFFIQMLLLFGLVWVV